jgi:hypothetical protein
MLGALWWLKGLAEHVSDWSAAVLRDDYSDPLGVLWVALAAMWAVLGVFMLYLCRLDWLYTSHIQAAAGGRITSHREWTELQWRLARLSAAAWVVLVVVDLGFYALNRWEGSGSGGPPATLSASR